MFSVDFKGHNYPPNQFAKLQLFFHLAKPHITNTLLNNHKIFCKY